MPVNHELARSLSFLRRKYKVKERDLLAIARKLNKHNDEPEVTWDEIILRTLRDRRGRFAKANAINRKRP